MEIIYRQENPADYEQVNEVVREAFKNEPTSDQTEHLLVERLRKSEAFIPQLSIVAVSNGAIIGHILLTKVEIKSENQSFESLSLAPVSVKPEYQNKGIGSRLVRKSHDIAKKLGFKSVMVLGHEHYYPKFGYQPASNFDIEFPFDAADKNCLAIELEKNGLKGVSGKVEYPKEFYG